MFLDMFLDMFNVSTLKSSEGWTRLNVSLRGMDTFKRVLETGHVPGHVAGDWTCFGHVHSDTFNVSENVSDSLVGNCTAIFFKYPLNFNFALVNRI